jgi:GNAT superfamily N-acetyltransferase
VTHLQLLDNITWHTLAGPHATYAAGTEGARRYADGFSPIAGFADAHRPDLAALARFCKPGERIFTDIWSGAAPPEWRIELESTMFVMVYEAAPPDAPDVDDAPRAVQLGPEHASQALELATLTNPGPFGIRTIELGDYFGYFEGPRLVAMAGERMYAGSLREISGVCTHPDFQGRGFARRLILELIRREMQRGETPFLHVLRGNAGARRLYERMGFRNYQEPVVRIISLR